MSPCKPHSPACNLQGFARLCAGRVARNPARMESGGPARTALPALLSSACRPRRSAIQMRHCSREGLVNALSTPGTYTLCLRRRAGCQRLLWPAHAAEPWQTARRSRPTIWAGLTRRYFAQQTPAAMELMLRRAPPLLPYLYPPRGCVADRGGLGRGFGQLTCCRA